MSGGPLPLTYVLPLRWESADGLAELGDYLRALDSVVAQLVVVDSSPPEVFAAIGNVVAARTIHRRPDPRHASAMGKVAGVLTGLDEASEERTVIADDDVRWDRDTLAQALRLLGEAELVRPQNYFAPAVWHARWDTARTLLNRVWNGDSDLSPGDFPGTLALRTRFVRDLGGYDGDCLFENLELMRTVLAAGGRVATPLGLYVRRRPPTARQFLAQRVRHAYDDFAIPPRMALWLSLGPGIVVAGLARRPGLIAGAAGLAIAIAEIGRRRAGGDAVFPATASLLAPAWLAERAVCSWLAVRDRLLRGGVFYRDARLAVSAHSVTELKTRLTVAGSPST